jgi:hypothetical protein
MKFLFESNHLFYLFCVFFRTLSEVITKYQELYLLIQTVQNDGDSSVIEDKPTIERLVDEMSYLSEACEVRPQAENNLVFEFENDVMSLLEKCAGKIIESGEMAGRL